MIAAPEAIAELEEIVRGAGARGAGARGGTGSATRLLPVAGGSKPGLSRSAREDVEPLDLSRLSGIVEYDPSELTITALAGTPVREVQATLAAHGQHLPFEPPLAAAGATLGGTVAAGASGAGAFRHGGVRDFVIGVQFIDGTGRLISGGGRVVKNAAGFDLPKLMVGSIGRLGVIVRLSFKVFPCPRATATVELALGDLDHALRAAAAVAANPVQPEALEITSGGGLLVRVGGRADTLDARLRRLLESVDTGAVTSAVTPAGTPAEAPAGPHAVTNAAITHEGEAELALWRDAAEFSWSPEGNALVRVSLSVRRLAGLDAALRATPGVRIRYSLGGTVAWISWPADAPLERLDALLHAQGLPGMVLIGPPDHALLGPSTGGVFGRRIAGALDPDDRFLEV